jgi:hypothetical protein
VDPLGNLFIANTFAKSVLEYSASAQEETLATTQGFEGTRA